MKRILVLFLLICGVAFSLKAQISGTVQSIGYAQGQQVIEVNGQQIVVGFSGGNAVNILNQTAAPETGLSSEVIAMAGFPQPVRYFPQVLDEDFFVSKGFFSTFVQLRWNVLTSSDQIDQFQIFRKPLGEPGDSILIATLGGDVFSFQDETADLGVVFEYTIFARGIADDLRIPLVNVLQEDGFAFPSGAVSGQITFEGGTAVENVTVVATTDGNLDGQGVALNGQDAFLRIPHNSSDPELELSDGFTIQLWTRYEDANGGVLFSKGNDYELSYDGNVVSFRVSDGLVTLPFQNPVDSFFHISAAFEPGGDISLHAFVTDERQFSTSAAAGTTPSDNLDPILFGRNLTGDFYQGQLDELRLWERVLPLEEIVSNYSRFIAGTEEGLTGYWRLDQGVTQEFYDFARRGATFFENHGTLINATFSTETPLESQLSFRGLTDQFGNYTITGFPYETNGSLYQFTPLFPFHTFAPNQQVRFVGPGAPIHNEVDFTDNSAFEVSGTIRYQGGPFPVQGSGILIDGQPAISADGELIVTDELGRFTVQVPIGLHSIRANLINHVFVDDGRFPPATPDDPSPLFDFQAPLAGIEFIDSTLIKVAGRIVGGPIEAAEPLGFSRSSNNIGNATISLSTSRGLDLVFADRDTTFNEFNAGEEINTSATFSGRNITVRPDVETGEFVLFLPPEEYRVDGVVAGDNIFDNSFLVGVDLRSEFNFTDEVLQDTVLVETVEGPLPGFPPVNPMDFDSVFTSTFQDTTFTIAVDTFSYQRRQDFIFRVAPTIAVTNLQGQEIFGEQEIAFIDENLGVNDTIPLFDEQTGIYTFGHPVFLQRGQYSLVVQLFEQYENADNGEIDTVPVVDGSVEITNNLAINDDMLSLELNEQGRVVYEFLGGVPNISVDPLTPENSFTQTLNITAVSGNNGAIRTIFNDGNPFRGIVFGGLPTGNNFVTTGPNQIDMILRDPPGSESFAFIEEGTTFSTANSFSFDNSLGQSLNRTVQLGGTVETAIGLGAEVTTEVEVTNTTTAGFEATVAFSSNEEFTNSITTTETISTSDELVGSDGDVFIGRATNIVYGISNFINVIPEQDCEVCGDVAVNGFRIGVDQGIRINPEFNTAFAFTQFFIEQQLIPNLENIRNSFLTFSSQADTINPIEGPAYISNIPPSDPRFGSSNTDVAVWGEEASTSVDSGPSYQIRFPANFTSGRSDTIFFFNEQIDDWIFWLAENERQKVEASLMENLSFSSGTTIDRSVEVTASSEATSSFSFTLDASIANELGFSVNENGLSEAFSFSTSSSFGSETSTSQEVSTTYGFSLGDGDLGDSYTVDVLEPGDGFGTVFRVRGGQTSCPYEDEERTTYFEPGTLINEATAQREVPVISVTESQLANIPANREANFSLNLQNNSETGEGFQLELDLVDGTNPFGAILEVDGAPLANGLIFQVNPGETLLQNLSVRQGPDDVFDYENIGLVLRSLCQSDPNDNLVEIADTVFVSAFFVPGCSDINISNPGQNWVVNTNTPQEDTLLVTIDGYDLNFENFTRMQFQYRAAGSSDFTTDITFFNALQVTQEEFDAAPEPKMLFSESSIIYPFDLSSLPDQEYDIRVVALCDQGPGVTFETPSEVLRGTKDTTRPRLFGAPQPADGVLSANDNISIRFSEPIVEGLLTPANFSVTGVLNNAPVDNNVSVNLDGVNDYVRIEDGLDVGSGSFTFEFKLRRNTINEEIVVVSKGFGNEDFLEIGFTADNRLFVEVSGERVQSTLQFTDTNNFNHYAVSYDAAAGELFAYENDRFVLEQVQLTNEFSGEGPIIIGRSGPQEDRHTNGNFLDFRVWDRFRSLPDVFANINTMLTGSEIGLIGYWPFDEGFGTLAADQARFRNATLFADWLVLPQGYALSFDGVDDFLEISTASTVVISDETDFTIEFWFNGGSQSNVTLFSSGRGINGTEIENNVDDPENSLSIGFNEEGQLSVASNGLITTLDIPSTELLDSDWHHFALSVSRVGNAGFFIDGNQVLSIPGSDFGGLLRATMALGARRFNTGALTQETDNFFEGSMDEFRIWNTALTGEQILLDRNARLAGSNLGLVAYYPFDAFGNVGGVQLLQPTLEDQFEDPFDGPNGGLANATGTTFSTNTPNVRLQRPVQEVPFEFVVNGDEIVITPSASANSIIERATLEITVANVEDQFENRLASPVTFTAFVDRNLVRWDREAIELEKMVDQGLVFEVEIVNQGGTDEQFDIVNLPPWLTTTSSSGSIPPQSTLTIEFTVNPGLSVGYYNEDIFLTTDFGFNEELNIDLEVMEEAPDWSINPADFEFSMSVVALLEVNNVISRDENDLVAAFVGDQVRGVTNLQFVPELDLYFAFLDVFSNQPDGSEVIEFRAFDADNGIEYRQLQPITPNFVPSTTLGNPSNPIVLSTGALRAETINFAPGFTWRSFNLVSPMLDNSNLLLEGVEAVTNDRVIGTGEVDVYTEGLGWIGSLSGNGGLDISTFFIFDLANGGTIDLEGTLVDPGTEITMAPGFNRIGVIPDFTLSVEEAFSSLPPTPGDIVRGQLSFAIYQQDLGWIGSLENISPLDGYLYFSNSEEVRSFVYPEASVLARSRSSTPLDKEVLPEIPDAWKFDFHEYPFNMSVIGTLIAPQSPDSYVLAAFDGDQVVGVANARFVDGNNLLFMTIFGTGEEREITFKALDKVTGEVFELTESVDYAVNAVRGSLSEPIVFNLGTVTEVEDVISSNDMLAIPNPFEEKIAFVLPTRAQHVILEVINPAGQQVYKIAHTSPDSALNTIEWEGVDQQGNVVANGVYLVKITTDNQTDIVRIIKQ